MALVFGAVNSDRVDCGSAATLDDRTTMTCVMWVKWNGGAGPVRFWGKGLGGGGYAYFGMPGGGTARLVATWDYTTTDATSQSSNSTLVSGSWQCVAVTFDNTNGPKLYAGSLSAPIAETGYAVGPTAPSGTRVSDAAQNFYIGNDEGAGASFTKAWPGSIASFALWNRVLSLGELLDQQFSPRVTSGCVLFAHLGFNGTGVQPDWSGKGNNGTVTGATQSAHAPLARPFGREDSSLPYIVAAPAAAAKFRRTLSPIGTRTGGRQMHAA